MLLVVLNKTLRKIRLLVSNCEKKKDRKTTKETRRAAEKHGESKPSTKMDTRHPTEKIPDPWFN